MTRYAAKRDLSERPILQALRQVGADYLLLDPFDVLVLYRGAVHMLEVKTPKKGRKTQTQIDLVQRGWPIVFVTDVQQALQAIGVKA